MQHLHQFLHVGEVQARGRLVEDVEGLTGAASRELQSQLDALGFASREGQRRLTHLDVPQTDLPEDPQLLGDCGYALEELERLVDGHLENLVDVLPLVTNLQGFPIETPALAHVTGDVHVRKEVHLDPGGPRPLTAFAAPALDIEREAPGRVAPGSGLRKGGKQLPDRREQAHVGRRVRTGSLADRSLVDVDDLVHVLDPLNVRILPFGQPRSPDPVRQHRIQQVGQEAGFARTRNPGDHRKNPKGKADGNALEVVLRRADQADRRAVSEPAPPGFRNVHGSGQEHPGQRRAGAQDLLVGPREYNLPAVHARPRTQIDDVVGGSQGLLVVLDHDQGVAQIPQAQQGVQQPPVVPLMQTDRGLVQDVQYPHEGRTDLGGQADALCFPAGQRRGPSLQGQVLQTHVDHEGQSVADLLEHLASDGLMSRPQVEGGEELQSLGDRQAGQFVDVHFPHADRQALRSQAFAAAGRALPLAHEPLEPLLDPLGTGLQVAAPQVRQNPPEIRHVFEAAGLLPVDVLELNLFLAAPQDRLHDLRGQAVPWSVEVEAEMTGQGLEQAPVPVGLGVVGGDGALVDRQAPVRDHQVRIEFQGHPQARAFPASPERAVEGEQPGLQLRDADAADRACPELGEELFPPVLGVRSSSLRRSCPSRPEAGPALCRSGPCLRRAPLLRPGRLGQGDEASGADLEGGLNTLGQALHGLGLNHQPIDHHLDIVLPVLVQLDGLVERADVPVDPDPHESRPPGVFQDLPVFAFLAPHHRRQEHHPRLRGQAGDAVHDLIDRLLADHPPALGTVGDADAREQKPQVVVDLRDGADRGTGVPLGGLLFDRDRRRQPLDVVHIWLVEAPQELAGVR